MIELFVLIAVLGCLWVAGAVLMLVFKLVFGVIGGVFSVIGGLIALLVGGTVMLAMLPVFAFMLLPLCLPLLLIAAVVWLIVRAAHPRPAPANAG
ncbi:MAG TPA: hypothetical protein VFJ04_01390 [Rhodanobacteraceae bacterium]|jgi:hypothetical protein|nr:hypothetical protein [Rhodanobacteraceae bacterium]